MSWTDIEKLDYGKDLRDSAVADYSKTNEVIDSLNNLGRYATDTLVEHEGRINTFNELCKKLKTSIDTNTENIKNNSDNIDNLVEWCNTADSKMTGMQTNIETNKTDISNIKIADVTLGNRISANTNDINANKTSIENMKSDVSTALSNASSAKTTAENAKTTAETVDSRVSTYDAKIATATTDAASAKTTAESAKTTAESFKTAIETNTANIKNNSDNIDEIAAWTNKEEVIINANTNQIALLGQTINNLKLTDLPGDEITLTNYSCGGFITSASQQIRFSIPLARFYNSDIASVSLKSGTTAKFTVRQQGKYCYGSSATTTTEATLSYASYQQAGIVLWFQFSNTTNAVNNESCGIAVESMTLVLS